MPSFRTEHLETLVALVEEGTFEAAAQRLSVTPSAISQRIKAMEKTTGQVLVQRSNPVEPTAAGDIALRYGRQMRLLEDEAARALALEEGEGGNGHLAIGCCHRTYIIRPARHRVSAASSLPFA